MDYAIFVSQLNRLGSAGSFSEIARSVQIGRCRSSIRQPQHLVVSIIGPEDWLTAMIGENLEAKKPLITKTKL